MPGFTFSLSLSNLSFPLILAHHLQYSFQYSDIVANFKIRSLKRFQKRVMVTGLNHENYDHDCCSGDISAFISS